MWAEASGMRTGGVEVEGRLAWPLSLSHIAGGVGNSAGHLVFWGPTAQHDSLRDRVGQL